MAKQLIWIAVALLLSTSARAEMLSHPIHIGAWEGNAYSNNSTGAFSHCAASAPYNSGITLFVSVTSDWGWSLGFSHASWSLRENDKIPILLTFGGRDKFRVMGTAITVADSTLVQVPMPDDSRLINSFRRAYRMETIAKGNRFGFDLTNTAQLLPALAYCVQTHLNYTRPEQTVSSINPGSGSETETSPELQIEAIQLATNFMLKSGLQNPKVLSRSETPSHFVSFGAAWTADNAVGAVKIVPADSTIKGIDVAAAVAGADAKECKGKFASGRDSELVDSEVVFRGFSSCEDGEGSRTAQFFVVPRKKGGFIIFSVAVASDAIGGSSSLAEDEGELKGFQRAALFAVE